LAEKKEKKEEEMFLSVLFVKVNGISIVAQDDGNFASVSKIFLFLSN
jgi:hypothetical protein